MNLLYSHYGVTSSSKIRLKNIMPLLIKAFEKEQEDWAWDMWLTLYPKMTKDTFTSFEDYKKELFKPNVKHTEKTAEEITEEMMAVVSVHEALAN